MPCLGSKPTIWRESGMGKVRYQYSLSLFASLDTSAWYLFAKGIQSVLNWVCHSKSKLKCQTLTRNWQLESHPMWIFIKLTTNTEISIGGTLPKTSVCTRPTRKKLNEDSASFGRSQTPMMSFSLLSKIRCKVFECHITKRCGDGYGNPSGTTLWPWVWECFSQLRMLPWKSQAYISEQRKKSSSMRCDNSDLTDWLGKKGKNF